MADNWINEKENFLSTTKKMINGLANVKGTSKLILAIIEVRDRAATANKREWKAEGYAAWLKELQALLY